MSYQSAPVIPGFRIVRELGHGGMASVYLAVQESLDREVALKVISPTLVASDDEFSQRFVNEGRTIAKLNHPNIVTVHDIAIANGHHYIAMEYIDGESLKQRMHRGLSPREGVETIKQVVAALGYAHKKGFVHRDVKPDNILTREDGTAVLTDFGIAKAADRATRMTATGMSIGTPHYMSPEQVRGESVDSRADIYSLGVVLYELLVNEPLYDADDSFAIGIKHINEPIPRLPAALARYQAVLDKALAKKPDDRYADVESLAEALTAIEEDGAGKTVPPTEVLPSAGATASSTSRTPWIAAGVVVIAVALGLGVFVTMEPAPGTGQTTDSALQASGESDDTSKADGIITTALELLEAGDPEAARTKLDQARALDADDERVAELSQRIEAALSRRQARAKEALDSTVKLLEAADLEAARSRLDEARALDAGAAEVAELARRIREAANRRETERAEALEDTRGLLDSDKLEAARSRLDEARRLGAGGEAVAELERRIQEMQTRRSLAKELLVKAETALEADRLSEALGHCESAREFFSGPLANDGVCDRVERRRAEVTQQWQQQNIGTQGTTQVE